MDEKKGSWKSRLLSSSVPLEHATARCLASRGLSVEADFAYARPDASGIEKDFSVDLHGECEINEDPCIASVDVLVECKYRNPNVHWLFLPDPNTNSDGETGSSGSVPALVDEFSPYHLSREPSKAFAYSQPYVYKAVEVSADGHVYSAEIAHGIEQLRYALPRSVKEAIDDGVYGDWNEIRPRIVVPILVTTAPLIVVPRDFSPEMVAGAENIVSLGRTVPWLLLGANAGPDHSRYCSREFSEYRPVTHDHEEPNPNWGLICCPIYDFDALHKPHDASGESLLRALSDKRPYGLCRFFEEFLVCSFEHLPDLLDELLGVATDTCTEGKKLAPDEVQGGIKETPIACAAGNKDSTAGPDEGEDTPG